VDGKAVYKIIGILCRVEIPYNTGDFRVVNRKTVDSVKNLRETHRFIRGLVPWLGFKSEDFYYDREKCQSGKTKYFFEKILSFALDAIFSFSPFPLRIARYVGILLLFFGFAGASYILYLNFFTGNITPGLTTMLTSIVILSGIQILILGIIGEHVGRIFEETKKASLHSEKTHNLEGFENS